MTPFDGIAARARAVGVAQLRLARYLLRWIPLGALVGALAGAAAFVFLEVLDRVTTFRNGHGWIVLFMPVAGLLIGLAYHYVGGRSRGGNSLLLDEIHDPSDWVPRRMAPLVLVGTWLTHLVGGSAGREGTGVQMAGTLADAVSRFLNFKVEDRRRMLVAGLSGGFGAVFGVPAAGMVFGLEVQGIGRLRHDSIIPSLASSVTGDLVVRGLGRRHEIAAALRVPLHTAWLDLRVAVAAVAFGLLAAIFVELTHAIETVMSHLVRYPPLRPVIGSFVFLALLPLVGRDWLGLSLPLYHQARAGVAIAAGAFALKTLMTALTLGIGFPGGEVTPLLVMGATLGSTLAPLLGLPRAMLAGIGAVALLAGAVNVPITGVLMGVELFGGAAVVQLAIACTVAYVCSGHRGVYGGQRIFAAKDGGALEVGRRLRGPT